MFCKYCELIRSTDESYPLREATRDLSSDFPRCEWHWRFVCDICGKPRHFNGITWCRKTRKFTCILCGVDHRLIKGNFWNWKTFYAIGCSDCGERHPALDRLEFQGEHPWQLHPEMLRKRTGLSTEQENQKYARRFLSQRAFLTEKDIARAWDEIAEEWFKRYNEFGEPNRKYVIDPIIFNILGRINGKRILDAGCGNGYLCRVLAKQGAKMVGVDISAKAIEMAETREKEEPLGISYYVGSICNLSMFQDKTFDVIVSNIVFQDLQDLDGTISELHRVLKIGGKLVFSLMHPCFWGPAVHGWVKRPVDSDRKEDWLYWKIDRYFDRTIEIYQYFDLLGTYSFHRPLSDYIKALLRNGFIITEFEEPVPTNKDMEEHYRQFGNEYDRIPWFLVIAAKKLGISIKD